MTIGIFVDAAYIWKTHKEFTDYLKLRQFIEEELGDTVDEGYFFDVDTGPTKASKLHNLLTFPPPKGPGFRVKTYWLQKKPLFWPKKLGGQPVLHPDNPTIQYELTTQKAVDVGLVYHMTRSHSKRKWDKLVLAAGDADFHEPVRNLVEAENVDLYLIGSLANISEELRPYARAIFEIDKEPLCSRLKLHTWQNPIIPAPQNGQDIPLKLRLTSAINATAQDNGWAFLSAVGILLSKTDPSFDPRNYGFEKLGELVKAQPYLEVTTPSIDPRVIDISVRVRET